MFKLFQFFLMLFLLPIFLSKLYFIFVFPSVNCLDFILPKTILLPWFPSIFQLSLFVCLINQFFMKGWWFVLSSVSFHIQGSKLFIWIIGFDWFEFWVSISGLQLFLWISCHLQDLFLLWDLILILTASNYGEILTVRSLFSNFY